MKDYTAAQKLASLRRELKMRKEMYPRLVDGDRMTLQQAEREIDIIEAIIADYELVAERELL